MNVDGFLWAVIPLVMILLVGFLQIRTAKTGKSRLIPLIVVIGAVIVAGYILARTLFLGGF